MGALTDTITQHRAHLVRARLFATDRSIAEKPMGRGKATDGTEEKCVREMCG